MLDRQRLLKLMMMTQSDNDGEALVALRKANAVLKAENMTWIDLLGLQAQLERLKRSPMKPAGRGTTDTMPKNRFTDNDIPRMLQSLLRDTKGDFRTMLESLYEQWNERHYLTERQYEVVINAYEREK